MNSVAADIMACVSNYGIGGIEALPAPTLHEQMNDPDCELSADEICYIAINVASDMISEVDMVNCGKQATVLPQDAESVQQVARATSELSNPAATGTGGQPPTSQSHSQSLSQTRQAAVL